MTTDNPAAEPGRPSTVVGSYRDDFDWTDTQPSTAVVDVVTTAADCGPTETEPLYDVIDPDALDTIVTGSSSPVTVDFTFDSIDVTVSSDGWVSVRP